MSRLGRMRTERLEPVAGQMNGLLADALDYPADFSWVRYRLRPNAKWHDGTPVSVEDVLFSMESFKKHHPSYSAYYRHVTKAEKTGEREVTFTFDAPEGLDMSGWPVTAALDDRGYFKPDAGMLLGSPANADPVEPHDVQAEEIDIATAIWRIEQISSLRIRRPTRVWAGLRSFVDDGDLVGGFDPALPGLFWLAAQGGYGIQTGEAMGRACAALIAGAPMPDDLVALGVTPEALSPARLSAAKNP